jgi:hypothetical protein
MAHIRVTTVDGNTHDLPNHEFSAIFDGEIYFNDLSTVQGTATTGQTSTGLNFELKDVEDVQTN